MADTTKEDLSKAQGISGEAFRSNLTKIEEMRNIMFIVGGIVAGILGLTSYKGLIMLALTGIATSIVLLFKTNFDIPKYTNTNIIHFTIIGIQLNAMSFVLFWTLVYAIVNLF